MNRSRGAFAEFWRAEGTLSVLLALLVISDLIVPALAPDRGSRDPLSGAFLSCVLLAGAASVWRYARRPIGRAVAIVCLAVMAAWWLAWFEPAQVPASLRPASTALAMLLLAIVVVTSVLRAGTVTRHQIEGAIAAFLLLGLAWANAYEWLSMANPGAFRGLGPADAMQWTYYSFVTLTTVGYGDITPVSAGARSLAVSEALTGQMYVAILISRLVSLHLHQRK